METFSILQIVFSLDELELSRYLKTGKYNTVYVQWNTNGMEQFFST